MLDDGIDDDQISINGIDGIDGDDNGIDGTDDDNDEDDASLHLESSILESHQVNPNHDHLPRQKTTCAMAGPPHWAQIIAPVAGGFCNSLVGH